MTRATAYPDQVTTLEQEVCETTYGGAQCLGFERPENLGSIEEIKIADMIVLDQNLFEIEKTEIYGTRVLQTILGGKLVYDRNRQGNEDIDPDTMVDRMID